MSMYKQSTTKIHHTKRGLFGSCGELQDNAAVREWLDREWTSASSKPTVADGFHGIVIDGGKVFSMESKLVLMEQGMPFYACGSGRDYAMAAMHLGCDAKKAVQVAAVFDVNTGGEVVELRAAQDRLATVR